MAKQTLKRGTRIEVPVFHFDGTKQVEYARIMEPVWVEAYDAVGTGENWYRVKFEDAGQMCIHPTSFRVIDNHAF